MNSRDAGKAAEDRAREFLAAKGYRFLDANYRTPQGELDLVMERGDAVVFVEVKARGSEAYGRPYETVTRAKQEKLARAAMSYVKLRNLAGRPLRFDIVSLGPSGLEHLENAFVPQAGRYTI